MPRVAVVTDSTASLPSTMYEQYQIDIVPYCAHQRQALRDTVDVTTGELCDYLNKLAGRCGVAHNGVSRAG